MHPRATGSAQAGPATTEAQISELQMVANRLDDLMIFATHQGEGIERIDARLNGHGPVPEAKPLGPVPVPSGLVGLLNSKLDEIKARLEYTDQAISRINSAV